MNNFIPYILLSAIIFVIVLLIYLKKKKKNSENTLTLYHDVIERTPLGLTLASKYGVSQEFKDIADESLTKLFEDAEIHAMNRGLQYNDKMRHSDYIVYVLHTCEPSPEQQLMSFRLPANDYDGTIFDQDPRPGIGVIFATEYVIPNGSGGLSSEYVICNSMSELRENIRYGAEHIIYYYNDLEEYERTKFHGNGISHPIIPKY